MSEDPVCVTILLLGDEGVGKSTFLSRLTIGTNGTSNPGASVETLPPYDLPKLRDLDQPFIFNIRMYNRLYRFDFYDTASPQNFTLLRPDFVIACFDISRRSSLANVTGKWKELIAEYFDQQEKTPIMVLGLKRDLRKEWTASEKEAASNALDGMEGRRGGTGGVTTAWESNVDDTRSIMPEEGLKVAQEMRCDRYAECSALTGELCSQVLEDIARTAAKTTTDLGGKSGGACVLM